MSYETHTFSKVVFSDSKILILGSFPSVLSRKSGFYYMHPGNRFWAVLTAIYNDDFVKATTEEKLQLLKRHRIALYDVIDSCEIEGSRDDRIKNVHPTDIQSLIDESSIERILLNGKLAGNLFFRHNPNISIKAIVVPSTSARNASINLDTLISRWSTALH